jgi:hypothetical protein
MRDREYPYIIAIAYCVTVSTHIIVIAHELRDVIV